MVDELCFSEGILDVVVVLNFIFKDVDLGLGSYGVYGDDFTFIVII
jgi:hypothetical protein